MKSSKWVGLGICLVVVALASCGGGNNSDTSSKGKLNIIPDSIQLRSGASKVVPFELKESPKVAPSELKQSQGVLNQTVNFRVSNPELAHVNPSSCVVSSDSGQSASCAFTVTGKKTGTVQVFAEADGYESDLMPVTITEQNPYGTLSVTPSTAISQTYYTKGRNIPFSITVQFTPTAGGKSIPQDNPLFVYMNQPDGSPFTFTTQQCSLSTKSPTCSISGTLDATKVSSTGFASTISVAGSWQAPPAPFGPADDITINWVGTSVQQPGTITVSSQNQSNQVYTGMRAPLFVKLDGN